MTYQQILTLLQPHANPKQIHVDFEMAAIKAIKEIFPDVKIQGCDFHRLQNILRNLNTRQLKGRYEKDAKFASEIRQMQAVAFLPVDQASKY